jgi:hypothetical protein
MLLSQICSGIITSGQFNLPHLLRPVHGANDVNWVLAHVLPRVLAAVSRVNEVMSHLQADHGSE